LSSNRLYGTIPTALGQLSWLTSLRINDNRLEGTLPSQLPWKRLDVFDATFNNLTGTIPAQAQPRYW
jgi:Leucine-rich repeat (LRR) protein